MPADPRSFVFTRAELLQRGLDDQQIASAVAETRLTRLRRGWYAAPDIPSDLRAAVAAGGRLACVSAMTWHGVWTLPHRLHVSFPHAAHRPAMPHSTHWNRAPALDLDSLVESPQDAFEQLAKCGTGREVVVVADSAINLGVMTMTAVERVLESTDRGRRLLSRIDGKAESGTETLVRLALRARGVRLRSQVPIMGVGRVDFVIGDRLVVEVDGERWHDRPSTFESDRRRDALLVVRGFVVLRFTYNRVINELGSVVAEIAELIDRREHRWHGRQRNNYG